MENACADTPGCHAALLLDEEKGLFQALYQKAIERPNASESLSLMDGSASGSHD